MADITGRTGTQVNMSIFGKNLSDKKVDIYQILITTGDPLSFGMDNMSGGNYDWITVRDRKGDIIGQVQGDAQDPQGEISFSILEDYDYLNENYIYGNNKNRMLAMFKGEAFKNDEHIIVPIGTNGTDKSKTKLAKFSERNKPYKYLLHNEGGLVKISGTADATTGEVSFEKNPFEGSFNQAYKTFCLEARTETGLAQETKMFALLAPSTMEYAGGDTNQINITAQRGCDMFVRDDFWTEVRKDKPVEVGSVLKELYVNYIVKEGATEPTAGKNGDLIAIAKNDGTVEIKKYSASSYTKDGATEGKLALGTRIKSNKLREANETDTSVNCFIAIGKDKKAVDFSTEGSGRHYCIVYDFDRTQGKFVPYVSE